MSRADAPDDVAKHGDHYHGPAEDAAVQSAPEEHTQQKQAAELIQRNYRGYRSRRQLQGMALDSSSRWAEAIKEARWRQATQPVSRAQQRSMSQSPSSPEERSRANSNVARSKWKRVGEIARRAGGDDCSDASADEDELTEEQRAEYRQIRTHQKAERGKTAKMMDLQYFLEMVDQKHRYGSNLRAYHDYWKRQETNENFFYWIDYGEGKYFEHPTVSRERLEKEQVRYLTREERMQYLVKFDEDGRLCWAKNGERISTTTEYKDSVAGIVPKDDAAPAYASGGRIEGGGSSSVSSSSSGSSEQSDVQGEHYVNHELDKAKGFSKISHVSAATLLNHLLRGSVKPNSWIFVADTSFRLYVGIKQSGAFQHSSFLHGARISAAGLIKIKDGQLRRLSPLSGHYRPPTRNFRAFVHSLQDDGVDMSRVSISRAYAVLVGLEAYVKTRRKFKNGIQHVSETETKVMHPEEHRKKVEEAKDKSKSAETERQLLGAKAEKQEAVRKENSWHRKIWRKMRVGSISSKDELKEAKEEKRKKTLSKAGEDVESGIPPAGRRDKVGAA